MAQRICAIDGCDRPHRARGMCAMHYNRQSPTRHPKIETPCVVCSTLVLRRGDRQTRATCSVQCRNVVQYGSPPLASRFDWSADAKMRARQAGAPIVDDFDRADVFDRDAWTCCLCGIHVTEPSPYDLDSATVDHVIPLSRGGEHSMANAQTACLRCNSTKRDDLAAEKGWGMPLYAHAI